MDPRLPSQPSRRQLHGRREGPLPADQRVAAWPTGMTHSASRPRYGYLPATSRQYQPSETRLNTTLPPSTAAPRTADLPNTAPARGAVPRDFRYSGFNFDHLIPTFTVGPSQAMPSFEQAASPFLYGASGGMGNDSPYVMAQMAGPPDSHRQYPLAAAALRRQHPTIATSGQVNGRHPVPTRLPGMNPSQHEPRLQPPLPQQAPTASSLSQQSGTRHTDGGLGPHTSLESYAHRMPAQSPYIICGATRSAPHLSGLDEGKAHSNANLHLPPRSPPLAATSSHSAPGTPLKSTLAVAATTSTATQDTYSSSHVRAPITVGLELNQVPFPEQINEPFALPASQPAVPHSSRSRIRGQKSVPLRLSCGPGSSILVTQEGSQTGQTSRRGSYSTNPAAEVSVTARTPVPCTPSRVTFRAEKPVRPSLEAPVPHNCRNPECFGLCQSDKSDYSSSDVTQSVQTYTAPALSVSPEKEMSDLPDTNDRSTIAGSVIAFDGTWGNDEEDTPPVPPLPSSVTVKSAPGLALPDQDVHLKKQPVQRRSRNRTRIQRFHEDIISRPSGGLSHPEEVCQSSRESEQTRVSTEQEQRDELEREPRRRTKHKGERRARSVHPHALPTVDKSVAADAPIGRFERIKEEHRYRSRPCPNARKARHDVREEVVRTKFSDALPYVLTHTSSRVLQSLLQHLTVMEVKSLMHSCSAIRGKLTSEEGERCIVKQFLANIGYQHWSDRDRTSKDAIPLGFKEVEGFLIGHDLLGEYKIAAFKLQTNPGSLDSRVPQLARATTRAYNRIVARLRAQDRLVFPALPNENQHAEKCPSGVHEAEPDSPSVPCPWKEGRAACFRVWVPGKDSKTGWLSDAELTLCEQEVFRSGVWRHMRPGDVVWDTALGQERNEGKFIFDGRFLRDLSYLHDPAGHLPSWLNAFAYPPSHFHNIIASSSNRPVLYLDLVPYRSYVLNSLELVAANFLVGHKHVKRWVYRANIPLPAGSGAHKAWAGTVVLELDSALESIHDLLYRCAGAQATKVQLNHLLTWVLEDEAQNERQEPELLQCHPGEKGKTSPWMILRERSRPGMIYLSPVQAEPHT